MGDDATDTAEADPVEEPTADTDADADADPAVDVDDDEDFDDDEFDDATCAERVLDICLRAIVDRPEDIDIGVDEHDRRLTLHVRVATEDMGKIIGKRGRVANALRTLVKAAGSREGYSATVEIDD